MRAFASAERSLRFAIGLLSVVMPALGAPAVDKAPSPDKTVMVTVAENESLKPMSNEYLGYNFEWVGLQSLFLNNDGSVDPEAIEKTADIPLPFNRVSGTVSQEISWKGAIGPASERTVQKLVDWQPAAKILFGPVEWARWIISQNPDAKFSWTVNILKDSPQDAADLVEFLTGDGRTNPNGGIDWAQRRKDLGLENPLNVVVWEIGNEMDLNIPAKKYVWDSKTYIEKSGAVIDAIKSVDPNAKIAIQASSYFLWEWNEPVLKALGDKSDFMIVHLYYQGRPAPGGIKEIGKSLKQLQTWTYKTTSHIKAATGSDRIKLLISEYAMWPWEPTDRPWKTNWWLTHSLEGCLTTAQMVTWYLNRPDIAMANYHSFCGGPWKLIDRDEKTGEIGETAMADTFRLLGQLGGAEEIVPVKLSGFGIGSSPGLSDFAAAAVRSRETVQVLLVNRGEERTVNLQFQSPCRMTKAFCLTGPDLDSYNSADSKPVGVAPYNVPAEAAAPGAEKSLRMPAHSVLLVDIEVVAVAERLNRFPINSHLITHK